MFRGTEWEILYILRTQLVIQTSSSSSPHHRAPWLPTRPPPATLDFSGHFSITDFTAHFPNIKCHRIASWVLGHKRSAFFFLSRIATWSAPKVDFAWVWNWGPETACVGPSGARMLRWKNVHYLWAIKLRFSGSECCVILRRVGVLCVWDSLLSSVWSGFGTSRQLSGPGGIMSGMPSLSSSSSHSSPSPSLSVSSWELLITNGQLSLVSWWPSPSLQGEGTWSQNVNESWSIRSSGGKKLWYM